MKNILPNADFVIEGYVDPTEPLRDEGPFGDHTGYYTLPIGIPALARSRSLGCCETAERLKSCNVRFRLRAQQSTRLGWCEIILWA